MTTRERKIQLKSKDPPKRGRREGRTQAPSPIALLARAAVVQFQQQMPVRQREPKKQMLLARH